jgi:hypothetical protein
LKHADLKKLNADGVKKAFVKKIMKIMKIHANKRLFNVVGAKNKFIF